MICVAVIVGSYLAMGNRTDIWGIPMLSEPMDMGWLILFFAMLVGASDPARRLADIFTQFQSAAAAADRVYAMIDRIVPISDPEHPKPLPAHRESIAFDRISFEYNSGRPVLKEVSLQIKFGECIAILGASGCGKSTLMSLIPRFTDPKMGQVLIDGQPVNAFRLRDLRQQIGLVTQDPILFNDTVLANIRYGRAEATREEIIEAAKQAFAHDFIEKELPAGYDTVIGPAGGQLSGGQRQRIALARAMLRNPSIFLLDEATSQIDIQSERMIHEALTTFKKGRTTIMVTHRLSAVLLADRIVLMDDGRIIAAGTHEDLLKNSPEYAAIQE
jgi:ATP-binding cassette subfamily B protein/subfamily B ATP-binding cassette protein MsbA